VKRLVLGVSFALGACAPRPKTPGPAPTMGRAVTACAYDVVELSAEPAALEVRAQCQGQRITGFSPADDDSAHFLSLLDASPTLSATSAGWQFATPQRNVTLRYRVDLEGVANASQRFDAALRIGHSLIAPASTFLVQPEPLDVGVPIDLTVHVPTGEDFASGLIPDGGAADRHYRLQAHEMSVATYSIFGHFSRDAVSLAGSTVEVVTADGALDASRDVYRRWVSDSATAVGRFYGHFPAPNALVLLMPVPERDAVVFGKVLPQSAPGVAVLVGQHTSKTALYGDWILVHELFHLGFPSFHDEAKWLDEGSATYFEPLIRARAGYLTELEVWTEFARDMPKGLRAIEQEGLEHPSDFRSIYWGGAIACLMADVAARTRTNDAVGLEDGFRAVLQAGGNAAQVWSLAQVTRVIDSALGAPILREIVAKHANRAEPVELPALLERLGVHTTSSGITLDDHAELAQVRRAITFGSRPH
jgi:hypothetical protein